MAKQVWESQKGKGINIITASIRIHLPKSVSTDLMIQIQF